VIEMDVCSCSNFELKSSKKLEILTKDTSRKEEKDRIFGYLLTIDLYGIESSRCDDLRLGYDFLDKLPCYLGMNKQSLPHIYATPAEWIGKGGLSGWVGIVESGIQLHTLSDEGFVSIDMYTCSYLDQSMVPKILEFVHKYYPYKDVETNFVKRGLKYYQNGK
jgi:S-adenosylmethionine/arginine decarboxylase-like enzyme